MFLKSLPEGDLHFEKHKKYILKFQIETRDPRTRTQPPLNQVVRSIIRWRTLNKENHKPVNLDGPETPDSMNEKTFFGSLGPAENFPCKFYFY